MTPEESIRLGREAQSFLDENEAFRLGVGEVRDNLLATFKGDDDEKAMEARRQAKLLEDLISRMARRAEIGRVTAKKLAQDRVDAEEGDDT